MDQAFITKSGEFIEGQCLNKGKVHSTYALMCSDGAWYTTGSLV
jgi:hypothetical protein